MTEKPLALPPELAAVLGELGEPTLVDATNVGRPTSDPWQSSKTAVFVSYIPRLRCFSAHKDGLGEIRTSSMPELLAKLTRLLPKKEFRLVLSKVARAEVARRKNGGGPMPPGWY